MIKRHVSKVAVLSRFNSIRMLSALLLTALSPALVAEVEQVCIDRFAANGAIPGDASCAVLALTSRGGLSNFACTGPRGEEIITEYCGLVDDDECDFRPLETVNGSISLDDSLMLGDQQASTIVTTDVTRLLNAQYGAQFVLAGTNFLAVFPFVFGLADLAYSPIDFGSEFSELGDFGGLINNLEDCP